MEGLLKCPHGLVTGCGGGPGVENLSTSAGR